MWQCGEESGGDSDLMTEPTENITEEEMEDNGNTASESEGEREEDGEGEGEESDPSLNDVTHHHHHDGYILDGGGTEDCEMCDDSARSEVYLLDQAKRQHTFVVHRRIEREDTVTVLQSLSSPASWIVMKTYRQSAHPSSLSPPSPLHFPSSLPLDISSSAYSLSQSREAAVYKHPLLSRSPYFVRLLGEGRSFILLECKERGDFQQYLRDRPDMRVTQSLLRIFVMILRGLRTMHACGFVHGDVWHKNVVFDGRGAPFLIDFSFSRELGRGEGGGREEGERDGEEGFVYEGNRYFSPSERFHVMGKWRRRLSRVSEVFSFGLFLFFTVYSDSAALTTPRQFEDSLSAFEAKKRSAEMLFSRGQLPPSALPSFLLSSLSYTLSVPLFLSRVLSMDPTLRPTWEEVEASLFGEMEKEMD